MDQRVTPTLSFNIPTDNNPFSLEKISDESMSSLVEGGRRGGYITIPIHGDLIHPIQWSARKLRRDALSRSTAELLSASDAASTLVYSQEVLS